jgi:ribulose-phosphate 3-epimerase
MIKIAPSILSADFARLGQQIVEAEVGGADYIHVDVMDGHFVPNITIGPLIVKAIRPLTKKPLDVHLMIEHPEQYVDSFAQAGADILTVHVEACVHLHRVVQQIRGAGMRPGVALNPATPLVMADEILPDVDLLLIMSVNPGFGGQQFIPGALDRITRMRKAIEDRGLRVELEVDGGVNQGTIRSIVAAGAQVLVAGSAVYGTSESVGVAIAALRSMATPGGRSE